MTRRKALVALGNVLICAARPTFAQMQPFALRLVRRAGFAEFMGKNRCVISDLYESTPEFPLSDLGTKLCNAIELAYRNNIELISAIPLGEYPGTILTEGPLGWRIKLTGTGERRGIRIHIGNSPVDTEGCILPGTGDSTDTRCFISGSAAALETIKDAYGRSNVRPVVLRVQT
jgi:hypothetical protein